MQIPSEDTKKATLPIEPSNAASAGIEEDNKDAAENQEEGEDDFEEEENKGQPKATKIINQKQSNIPIATPEVEEYKELLEQNAQ